MAKKRLAEFLREEAHKSLDLDGATPETNGAGEELASTSKPTAKADSGKTTTAAKRSPQTKAQADPSTKPASAKSTAATAKSSQDGRAPQKAEGSAQPQASTRTRSTRKSSNSTPQGESAMTPVQTPEIESIDKTENGSANASNAVQGITQAQLDEAIAELKATLQETKVREETLQHQVEMLQTELTEQRELAQQLQTKQDKSAHLEKELEEARKVILQLSELNQKLANNAQPTKPQPPAEVPASPPQRASLPKPLPTPPDPLQLLESTPQRPTPAPVRPHQSQTSQMELRKVLKHPVTPTIPPTTLSNEEIGWVD